MKLAYNIDFELAGIAFLAIIAVFLRVRFGTGKKNSVMFRRFFHYLIAVEVLDIVSAITISYADRVPLIVNLLINTVYFGLSAITEYTLVRYLSLFVPEKRNVKINRVIGIVLTAVYVALLAANLFGGFIFRFENGQYLHGSMHFMTYVFPAFFIADAFYLIIRNRDAFSRKTIICVAVFDLLAISGMGMQYFLFPDILLSFFGASLAVLIMAFTLETPDFIKLQKTMEELKETNSKLEDLRENLQREVAAQTEELRQRQLKVQQMSIDTVQALAVAIDAKDEYTNGHSKRVSEYAAAVARRLNYTEGEIEKLTVAAILHDIGKIGVPDRILNKPGKLTDIEYEIIKRHTLIGSEILSGIDGISLAAEVAHWHHERWDGNGYPDGLKGEEIPSAARLVCIADSFDAMNSRRVYRKEMGSDIIREEMVKGTGKQFDPEMMKVFLELYDAGELEQYAAVKPMPTVISENLNYQDADNDHLTGLPDRIAAEHMISEAMQRASGYVALIDVDRLRRINDRYGYMIGDEALTEIADMIKNRIKGSIICRIGGDEFLLFSEAAGDKETRVQLDSILAGVEKLRDKTEFLQDISLTIGAVCSRPGQKYTDVFAKADKALFHMKQSERSGVFIYREHVFEKHSASRDLEELVTSLKRNGEYSGAMKLNYAEFSRIYKYISSVSERYHSGFSLVMITLGSAAGENLYVENMEKAMDCMEESIRQVIRRVDVCTRYSTVQFLVMLIRVDREEIDRIVDRIFRCFYRLYGSDQIQPDYAIAELEAVDAKQEEGFRRDNTEAEHE